jgi:hypothetical protein
MRLCRDTRCCQEVHEAAGSSSMHRLPGRFMHRLPGRCIHRLPGSCTRRLPRSCMHRLPGSCMHRLPGLEYVVVPAQRKATTAQLTSRATRVVTSKEEVHQYQVQAPQGHTSLQLCLGRNQGYLNLPWGFVLHVYTNTYISVNMNSTWGLETYLVPLKAMLNTCMSLRSLELILRNLLLCLSLVVLLVSWAVFALRCARTTYSSRT